MSSLFIRFGANAHDIAKRSIYSIGCHCYTNRRLLSADAATVANRQNESTAASKNEAAVQKLQQLYEADVKDGGVVPAFKRSLLYGSKIAVKDDIGEYTYTQLLNGSKALATQLSNVCGELIGLQKPIAQSSKRIRTVKSPVDSVLQVPPPIPKLRFYVQTPPFIRSFNGLVGFRVKLVSCAYRRHLLHEFLRCHSNF